jgi:hypothetical protein
VAASDVTLVGGGAVMTKSGNDVGDAEGAAEVSGAADKAGMSGGTTLGEGGGRYEGAGAGGASPGLLNEPMGGGALEGGTGAGKSDPGSGGALAMGGAAIWPISGTMPGASPDSDDTTATGRRPAAEELVAVSSFTARLI